MGRKLNFEDGTLKQARKIKNETLRTGIKSNKTGKIEEGMMMRKKRQLNVF